ncbi:MAG: hypothetical protein WAV46_04320 [Candidatus Moraniibacteriota bacterium]
MNIHTIIGVIGVGIYFIGIIPYFLDTFRGETRPNRVTWFGWTLLTWTAALIQSAHGTDASVMVVYAAAIVCTAIFILSLYRGVTIFSLIDVFSLTLGIAAYMAWLLLDAPATALAMNISADFLFAVPTLVKVWKMPKSESQLSWSMGCVSLGLALLSKTNFDFINTAFPLYLFLLNTLVFVLTIGFFQRLFRFRNTA